MKTKFSIIIPSWNNLPYLKLCVESIQKHSSASHEIIVHVNDGSDGTLDWVKNQNLKHTHSNSNVGICLAVNQALKLCTSDYTVYANDDMYFCPNWDTELWKAIATIDADCFMLSATMIEHSDTGNPAVIVKDFGKDLNSFNEKALLEAHKNLSKSDWQGSMWPPCLVPTNYWEKVNGFSEEFSPGMYSDPDFAMKLWQIGCRYFRGLGTSRVYHFQTKSTGKIVKNDGRSQFLKKWGISASTFIKYYLHRGAVFNGAAKEPSGLGYRLNMIKDRLKKALK